MRSSLSVSVLLAASFGFALNTEEERALKFLAEKDLIPGASASVQEGGACGRLNGKGVCAEGLCCGVQGTCGTGGDYCGAPDCQLEYSTACEGNIKPPGTDTTNVPRPQFGSVPYGVDITDCTVPGKLALTFDDGPFTWTNDLLDTLQANGVKATFFVCGNNGGKGQIQDASSGFPPMLQRMIADGHQIGSHSWSHPDFANISQQSTRIEQIVYNEIALADVIGLIPTYFRPPYTSWDQAALDLWGSMGYHVFNYDLDTEDWQGNYTYSYDFFQTTVDGSDPSTKSWIELSHDIMNQTVHGFAQFMIDTAKAKGFQFVTAGECLGDPIENWYRDPTTGQQWNPTTGGTPTNSTATTSAASNSTQPTSTSGAGGYGGSGGGDNGNPGSAPTGASTSSPAGATTSDSSRPFVSICLAFGLLVLGLLF